MTVAPATPPPADPLPAAGPPPPPARGVRVRLALRDAWRRLRGGELSPERAAASIAIGIFVAFVPLYGIQTLICLLLTLPLRLDFPLAWAVSNVANPLTAPFIIFCDIELGGWIAQGVWVGLSRRNFTVSQLGPFLVYAMIGGAAIGLFAGAAAGIATLFWLRRRARARAIV
jgi:uncharacterized protein (DUF2062 family)